MRNKYGSLIPEAERETQRALDLPKGRPEDLPVSMFPGPKAKALVGQLDIDGNEASSLRPRKAKR